MAAVEVPQTLEYRGGQLNAAPVLEVENFTNWKKRFLCHIIGIEPQFENIIKNGPFIPMIAGQRKPANQFTGDERKAANQQLKSLIIYKALMNELVNDDIKLSKLEINTDFINGLPKKWLSFCQSLRNTNHVKDSELASLFSKLKYEENLIDNIYETEKNKSLVSATPLLTAFFSSSIVQDFQDSPDDKEDTRSNQEYLNDLEEEYQARDLLAKSKRFFKKASKAPIVKNKGLIAEAYKWDEEKDPMVKNKENNVVGNESARNGKWVKISMRKVHTLLEMEDNDDRKVCLDYLCIDLNYVEEQRSNLLSKHRNLVHELNTCKEQLLVLKQAKLDFLTMQHVNTKILKENKNLRSELKELKEITKTWLNSSNKVNQCISEQIPSQKKKILGVDQLTKDPSSSGQKDLVFVKSSADDTKVTIPGVERPWLSEAEGFILPNHDTGRILPAESQRNTTDPSVAFTDSSATDYDSADESSVCSTPLPPLKKLEGAEPISGPKTIKSILKSKSTLKAEALKGVIINEPSSAPAKGNKSSSALKVHSAPVGKLKSVKIKDDPSLAIDYLFRKINPRNPQHAFKRCEACGSSNHTTTDHYDIEWFKRGEALQAKKAEALKSTRAESSNANRSKTPTKSGCSRHMTGVKSYLHKYVEQPGPKVVFGDDSTCTTKGYGSIKFVYVLDITSSAQESCFFAKASENLNWLWHKRLAHLNFKTINKLAKQNLIIGLPSLVYSKDKPCSSCEKGKHHRASFKTKQTSSIKKCLHLLHMDLFRPVTPRSNNHEKYTLVIVDEYSKYTWNSTLVNFCDEKGISQNVSSPYTYEQHGVAERKNRTLIEATRTMLSGSVFSKQYWTKVRIPSISFLHVFGCPVYIHNHKDHLGKFDEKADDGYLLGYSLVSKAFRVFNTRRKQTEETYHITFDKSLEAIKFSKPSVDNINVAELERYLHDEYLHPYEPSQRYQTNNNNVYFIEPYECPEPVVLETEISSDQNGQIDQNDQSVQNDKILNDDHSEHSNHTNYEQIIDNILNTEDIQISEHLSSPNAEDTLG
ncbi:retrovirus-related pol polyprotein from transposon TNT 1-94 [Tanacetum coccineum]